MILEEGLSFPERDEFIHHHGDQGGLLEQQVTITKEAGMPSAQGYPHYLAGNLSDPRCSEQLSVILGCHSILISYGVNFFPTPILLRALKELAFEISLSLL